MASKHLRLQTLTGATPTWNIAKYKMAEVDPTTDVVITIVGDDVPDAGVLHFKQDSSERSLEINGEEVTVDPEENSITEVSVSFTNLGMGINSGYSISAPDTTAPLVLSMQVMDANTIRVIFNETVSISTAGWSFDNGSALTIDSVATVTGKIKDFTITEDIASGETVTGTYNSGTGTTADNSANALISFTDEPVTNNLGAIFATDFAGSDGDAVVALVGTVGGTEHNMKVDGSGNNKDMGGNNWCEWSGVQHSRVEALLSAVPSGTGVLHIARVYLRSTTDRSTCIILSFNWETDGVLRYYLQQITSNSTILDYNGTVPEAVAAGWKLIFEVTDSDMTIGVADLTGVAIWSKTHAHTALPNASPRTKFLMYGSGFKITELIDRENAA